MLRRKTCCAAIMPLATAGADSEPRTSVRGDLPAPTNASGTEPPRDLKIAAHSEVTVALSGRVYGYVVATEDAVEVGDLLTTSSTPGHAMKVTDFARSQGCVLGKAMQPLAKGQKGLVLVLVTLQ